MDTPQLILLFHTENIEKNCPISIDNKKYLIEGFFMQCAKDCQEVTGEDIECYLMDLWGQGRNKKYVRRVKYALKAFYRFLDDKGTENQHPAQHIRNLKEINPPEPRKPWVLADNRILPENLTRVNEYLKHIYIENLSLETIGIYRQTLGRFIRDVRKPLAELTKPEVYDWFLKHYEDKEKTTQHNNLATLSSFFSYCLSKGYIQAPLLKKVWWPNRPKSTPKFLETNELEQVRIEAETLSLRDRTIVEFLNSTACRLGEMIRLNIEDINLENRTAQVMGKGRKPREVVFSEECALLLERYISSHPLGTGALFLNHNHQRLGGSWVKKMMNKLGKKVGLTRNLHAHRFRHTRATIMLSKGVPINLIRDFLGHDDDNTTQIYTNVPLQELQEIYRQCMG